MTNPYRYLLFAQPQAVTRGDYSNGNVLLRPLSESDAQDFLTEIVVNALNEAKTPQEVAAIRTRVREVGSATGIPTERYEGHFTTIAKWVSQK